MRVPSLTLIPTFIAASASLYLYLPQQVRAQTTTSFTNQCFNEAVAKYGLARAQQICQNATPSTSSCFNEMAPRYGVAQAQQICQGATPSTSSCFSQMAPRYGVAQAQQICQGGATSATSQCFNENAARFGIQRAQQLCSPTPNDPLAIQECIKSYLFDAQGRRTNISESAAAIACQRSVR
ncbi:hypothetical protein [Pseudanabaena sp. PCC 6802]|uniref:hypothetical protein n=1 Tax=Pseudanabaena sp. PCC 6802 TaxID=118173 RepID=UPI00035F504E|nr:hypothetical protein [Pseudanabaena sp. PCC 6802]